MLLSILLGLPAAWGLGYLTFWGVCLKRQGQSVLHKYAGFRSYRELRSHAIGMNILWSAILLVVGPFMAFTLGWPDGGFVVVFLAGYAYAFWQFLKKPKSEWDRERSFHPDEVG
ncbi:hypothetical protein [Montanilutibacter psychrotolerans]|uniref:Uncharacterized protein n=1 Tax=Montanilutibacter psychrotolerans TaxID=1327343 RepID=A0A3M8SW28_9GAMM|nr:hypothetical protein [Lysobacter psychrotolerans]RNF85033.1 hypothetical protein EER27_04385 [Lysobacter psychrotolerans]